MASATPSAAPASSPSFRVETPFYMALWGVHLLRGVFRRLGSLESSLMRRRLAPEGLDRPIYILGVPRCGTTVTLEMLSAHPSVATQRYADMLMPYVPYTWTFLAERILKIVDDKPQQRIHQDRMQVTKQSPEGAEELLWLEYFPHLHSEDSSCVLTEKDTNPAFDRFYVDTIQKLLLARGRSRFLSKANEDVTRLLYLHRLFPKARFLLFARHPAHHVASLMKQDRLFNKLAQQDPRIGPMTAFTGHFEFGPSKKWSRVGNEIGEVHRLYAAGEEALAWAHHWAAVYELVTRQLRENPSLAEATMIVRYEELCHAPAETIDRILAHTELDSAAFAATREGYLKKLTEPTYYRPSYTAHELQEMDRITAGARRALGYTDGAAEALGELRTTG
jgi:hypothetical protein